MLGTKTSLNAMACCGVVMAGFVIGSAGEINFSLIGWLFGIASSFFVALYGIYVKRALNHLNGDSGRKKKKQTRKTFSFRNNRCSFGVQYDFVNHHAASADLCD